MKKIIFALVLSVVFLASCKKSEVPAPADKSPLFVRVQAQDDNGTSENSIILKVR